MRYLEKLSSAFSQILRRFYTEVRGMLIAKRNKESYDVFVDNLEDAPICGIGIKFQNGVTVEQLSSAEKIIVSISLLLAFQLSDPSPFYLFDEIDADLDPTTRIYVSQLIFDMTTTYDENISPPQFIYSTFKKELVEISNKFFGTVSRNNISISKELSSIEALSHVTNLNEDDDLI
jgi:structural maintenance of chromosome 3 (chondroitin sulfate proteoglycan 6)